jgi:hypothetical protein
VRSAEDRIAIDASINTLVLARIALERRIQDKPLLTPSPDGGCTHERTFPIETGSGSVLMCNDCGDQLEG